MDGLAVDVWWAVEGCVVGQALALIVAWVVALAVEWVVMLAVELVVMLTATCD